MMMTFLLPLLGLENLQEKSSQTVPNAVESQETQGKDEIDPDKILVTGKRDRRETVDERRTRYAETPYATTERVPLNSRIKRTPDQRDFSSVATNQGLAALIGAGAGQNLEAAGGASLNRRLKKVQVCEASSQYVHEDIACGLIEAKTAIEASDYTSARELIDKLSGYGTLNDTERYFVETHRFMLAEATDDAQLRYDALAAMTTSGAMPDTEQVGAYRALLAMALKRSDETAAIDHLERLSALGVAEDQDLATLAILYDRAGNRDKAIVKMRAAIASTVAHGKTPPTTWTAFVVAGK